MEPAAPLPGTTETPQERLLRRLLAVATIVLMLATHRLWTGNSPLPQIPWFRFGTGIPLWFDRSILGLLLLSCGVMVLRPVHPNPARIWRLYIAIVACLVLLDQNRLQAWTWEFLLLAATFVLAPTSQRIPVARWIPIAAYFYSAVSKLDQTFLTQAGPRLVVELFGIPDHARPGWVTCLVWLLPLGELLMVMLLARPTTRMWGLRLSLLMHVTLILALGPFGLKHEWGVVLWNVYFVCQNLILYLPAAEPSPPVRWSPLLRAWVVILMTYPALAWIDRCDPWPAWVVYSERPTRVIARIHVEAISQLPAEFQSYVEPPPPLGEWAAVNLDSQSFQLLHTPLSPAGHYRLALWLAETQSIPHDFVGADIILPPSRLTGQREILELRSRQQIQQHAAQRWWNSNSR